MALAVTITRSSGSPSILALQAESFKVAYQRGPIQVPIPAGVDPILIDLGQFRPSVVISGTIRSVQDPTTDGTNTLFTKRTLEDLVTDQQHDRTITVSIVTEGLTDNYVAKVSSLNLEIMGGREFWSYTLSFVAQGRS